jgi:hypothetical protein
MSPRYSAQGQSAKYRKFALNFGQSRLAGRPTSCRRLIAASPALWWGWMATVMAGSSGSNVNAFHDP